MKSIINKIKEKWFWIKHPNLEYQCEVEDEKIMWREYLNSKESYKVFNEQEHKEMFELLK